MRPVATAAAELEVLALPVWPVVVAALASVVLVVASGWQGWLFIGAFLAAGSWWYAVHVRERTSSRIGASAHLLAELAHRLLPSATVRLEPPGVELTEADDLAERAVVVELERGQGVDEAVGRAAEIPGERIGADAAGPGAPAAIQAGRRRKGRGTCVRSSGATPGPWPSG